MIQEECSCGAQIKADLGMEHKERKLHENWRGRHAVSCMQMSADAPAGDDRLPFVLTLVTNLRQMLDLAYVPVGDVATALDKIADAIRVGSDD